MLMKKVELVFPSPLITLCRELFTYRNGQIHERVIKKSPANVLSNKRRPIIFPKIKKNKQQNNPNKKQVLSTLCNKFCSFLKLHTA